MLSFAGEFLISLFGVIILNATMMIVVIMSIVMLNVVMLIVILVNVVAPKQLSETQALFSFFIHF